MRVDQSFQAYGVRFGLRANDPAALARALSTLPLGWQPAPEGEVDILYSLHVASPGLDSHHWLYEGATLLASAPSLDGLLPILQHHAELLTAWLARDRLFVHAGVVGWRGRAILIPGRSMTGKTTLVKALVEAGATYYSDEYALLDDAGHVHPYARPLYVRADGAPYGQPVAVETLGGQVGTAPLPVGLVVVTHYQAGARWRPRRLTPGQALLALMDNTVAAQGDPAHSMPILRQVALHALTLRGQRGAAAATARALLRRLDRLTSSSTNA